MIELKEENIEGVFQEAIDTIHPQNSRLVSITKRVEAIDPLSFYDAAKQLRTERLYWSSTAEAYTLVGTGCAFEITAIKDRFETAEQEWNNLLNDAVSNNPYDVPGTGIVSMGGAAFDPEKEKTKLWANFEPIRFTVPEYLLTEYENDFYFTMNIMVRADDHPRQLANQLREMEGQLLNGTPRYESDTQIVGRHEISPEKWKQTVKLATEEIRQQKVEKIVLAREVRLKLDREADSGNILRKLLNTQSNSFIFSFERGKDCFIGATPERLVKIRQNSLFSTCLAGTAPRGETEEEDARISHKLFHDQKNRGEHDFVVQMMKKAIENYCTDIEIPNEPVVYPLKNLQHLYTPVTARMKKDYTILDIIKNLHPTPALGGTPRKESVAFIRKHELLDRGWYGAPVGWLDNRDNGEFAVAIRSGLLQGDEASLFAGCGVVKDSDPEEEYEETNIKLTPMLSVLGGVE
ncbi:Isochorismate synthase EntC [Oceanobacillus picturae]|uniref:Isochorismate synthase MenF n=1 Tax=Oceanobacillus picturae TaxID=171693 RepID=W9AK25_9BACI|nr:isochorismate synthase [Oceanobacillus picturae]CDO03026.1 Isochorismate synthase EntC [Oceanobacillus picturae]